MGRTFLPSISLALTCYSDSRARNVSFKRISSDQFRRLQTGSMDVSRDREHDRTHLRDLLTCSGRGLVSPVRRSESGGVFRPRKIPRKRVWARHSAAIQRHAIQETSQDCLTHTKHTQTLCPAAPGLRGMRELPQSSEPLQRC